MRMGKKKHPTYRVVVADSRSPRDGRNIETIGHYRPRQDPSVSDIDGEKALAWLRKGAQPTEQVQKLLTITGVWARYESERGSPAKTKLSRRAYANAPAPKPKSKAAPQPQAAATPPAPIEEPAAEEPAVEEPAVEEPAAEAPTGDAAAAE